MLDNASESAIHDIYVFDEGDIGAGTYGSVRRGVHRVTGAVRAIKIIPKDKLKYLPRFHQEIQIMKEMEHPNIVRLFETFEDAGFIYLVMELCVGGELFDRIISKRVFPEAEAVCTLKQILGAICYMHSKGVCHRDLKPENFLLATREGLEIKLIDFGLSARFVAGETVLHTKSGTPYYVAPEILSGSYTEKCDMWSVGVLAYVLLCGYPPFNAASDREILQKVKKGWFSFPDQDWAGVSALGKDFVSRLLAFDPKNRLSASAALNHDWIHTVPRDQPDRSTGNGELLLERLATFCRVPKLKKIALTAIAHQLADSEIADLKKNFVDLDTNSDGTLTIAEIKAGLDAAGVALPPDFETLVKGMDSDGSGCVDYVEFLAATLDRKTYMQRDVCWRAFRMFDRDGDGKISVAEFEEILKDDTIRGMISEFDLNNDGEIDFEEFMLMIQKPNVGTR